MNKKYFFIGAISFFLMTNNALADDSWAESLNAVEAIEQHITSNFPNKNTSYNSITISKDNKLQLHASTTLTLASAEGNATQIQLLCSQVDENNRFNCHQQ